MVQDFVQAAYRWVLGISDLVLGHLPWIIIGVALGFALWIAYRRLDPDGYGKVQPGIRRILAASARLVAVLLLATVLVGALTEAAKTVRTRREVVRQASASRRHEPRLSGVVQYAPVVALLQDKTYTRTLTLPPDFLSRVGVEGVQTLSPYLSDPSSENVLRMVDSFRRSGKDVVFTRELTRRDEVPVAADAAELRLNFKEQDSSNVRHNYEAELDGEYRFHNPQPQAATLRFAFPPPQGGGTVQELYVEINGQRLTEPDNQSLIAWSGEVPAGGQVVAKVHYRTNGAAAYDYALGSERRRIGDFHLVANSTNPAKFAKSGIFPSRMSGTEAEWRLKDVLTAQSVSIAFPASDLQAELLDKTLALQGLVLALFAVALAWLVPARAVAGTLAFGLGLVATPVLSSYAPPVVAILAGGLLGGIFASLATGSSRGLMLSAIAGAATLVFISVEHGALLLWLLALIGVVLTMRKGRAAGTVAV